jgi:hypothetical protein
MSRSTFCDRLDVALTKEDKIQPEKPKAPMGKKLEAVFADLCKTWFDTLTPEEQTFLLNIKGNYKKITSRIKPHTLYTRIKESIPHLEIGREQLGRWMNGTEK